MEKRVTIRTMGEGRKFLLFNRNGYFAIRISHTVIALRYRRFGL